VFLGAAIRGTRGGRFPVSTAIPLAFPVALAARLVAPGLVLWRLCRSRSPIPPNVA